MVPFEILRVRTAASQKAALDHGLQACLARVPGVHEVFFSPMTGALVLRYSAAVVSRLQLLEALRRLGLLVEDRARRPVPRRAASASAPSRAEVRPPRRRPRLRGVRAIGRLVMSVGIEGLVRSAARLA
jgi:hypothetical protein